MSANYFYISYKTKEMLRKKSFTNTLLILKIPETLKEHTVLYPSNSFFGRNCITLYIIKTYFIILKKSIFSLLY